MFTPRFCFRSFELLGPSGRDEVLGLLFEALIATNVAYLRLRPETPRLYDSPVRYLSEPPGTDDWQDIPETLARGYGDCEDLACWRIAELRVREGEHAVALLKRAESRRHVLYHVAVRRADGQWEDPSRRLGMNAR